MKVTITEAQFQRLLEFDRESDQEHKNYYRQTGFYGKIGSGCIILAKDTGRILLPKRSAEVTEPHTWGTWGGAVDIGEDTKYSAMREVYEETGYSGDVKLYPLCVYSKEDVFKYYSYLAVVEHEFTPELNWETETANWFDVNNLPSPLHFGVKYIFSNSSAVNVIKRFIPIDENLKNKLSDNILSEVSTKLSETSFYDIEPSTIISKTVNHYFKDEEDEITLYLENFKSTYEDALDDNITDEEIINSKEFKHFVYKQLEENLSEAITQIEEKIQNGKLILFRQMEVTQEWLENLSYNGKHLGIYWTYDKEAADAYWGKNKPFTIIISIEIDEKYINWKETLALNMNPTYSTEKEIRLFKNTPIKINSIERVKGSYYLPIDFLDMEQIKNKTFLA